MNSNDPLEQLFTEMDDLPVDQHAKRAAIQAAMTEFRQQQTAKQKPNQGSGQVHRPIRHYLLTYRKMFMALLNRKGTYAVLATACVAVVSVSLFQSQVLTPSPQVYQELAELDAGTAIDTNVTAAKAKKESVVTTGSVASGPASRSRQERVLEAMEERIQSEVIAQAPAPTQTLIATAPMPAPDQAFNKTSPSQIYDEGLGSMTMDNESVATKPEVEGRDRFQAVELNTVKRVAESPVSTFSVDVDTASYSFVRRQLNQGVLPQKAAIRAEEMINYFDYAYPTPPSASEPFKPSVVVQASPWNTGRQLIHIGIKGYELSQALQPRSNLVFLLDVSGSMNSPDKLPLVKQSMNLLLSRLKPEDTISIVVYAGAAGTVLEPTAVGHQQAIREALNRLQAGGSTAGAQGIKLAYQLAEANFQADAVNRVILATDGDFNVGITDREELKGFIERKRDKGIFLSVLGFGQGNYNDYLMQELAQNGNGVASYIDSLSEARKVLVDEATSTLFPIAKDVKIQVEFNPATVSEYRLIGYETRHLKREDFNNDKVDAGDIGAGHSVTAIYEIAPKDTDVRLSVDALRYRQQAQVTEVGQQNEYGFLKIRYKLPNDTKSNLLTQTIAKQSSTDDPLLVREAQFASAVAGFAQLLQGGKYTGDYRLDDVLKVAQANKGEDLYGYRSEFIQLVRKAMTAEAIR